MTDPIRFIVSLDDIRDARRLQQRTLVFVASTGLAALGLLLWLLTGNAWSAVVVAFAVLAVVEWRFPVFDRWFDRGRADVGMECDLWLDETGLAFHQRARNGSFETTGHIDWSMMTTVREDDRLLFIMDGRRARVGIPKRAFASREGLDAFRSKLPHPSASGREEIPPNY